MRLLILASITALALTGCTKTTDPSSANVYGSPFGQNVAGNSEGVMIGNVWNEMDAFPIAERFCDQYGKKARYKSTQGYRASFDCV